MIPLVEFCKNLPGELFGASYSRLKWLRNISIFKVFSLKYHQKYNQMLQFWCADDSNIEDDKKYSIGVEAMSIYISDSSDDEDVSRVDFTMI